MIFYLSGGSHLIRPLCNVMDSSVSKNSRVSDREVLKKIILKLKPNTFKFFMKLFVIGQLMIFLKA